jgi:hypothetical protein
MTTGIDTPRKGPGLAVVPLTDQAGEVTGMHMAHNHESLDIGGIQTQADQIPLTVVGM